MLAQQNLMDGALTLRISITSCWFDAYKCSMTAFIEALRAYRADYDDKRKAFTGPTPT